MNKKDEALSQFESVLKELKSGKGESATTAAVIGQSNANSNISGALFRLIFKFCGVKILLAVLLLIIITSGITWFFYGSTFTKESTTFVEQVREIANLQRLRPM